MSKHGDWSDIEVILSFSDKTNERSVSTLLSIRIGAEDAKLARNLVRLGVQRLQELLEKSVTDDVKVHIRQMAPQQHFKSLSDEFILSLLKEESDKNAESYCVAHRV